MTGISTLVNYNKTYEMTGISTMITNNIRQIAILINAAVTSTPTPFRRRFNFKKANWNAFSTDLDTRICDIDPSPENYDRFVKVVHATARKHIPRGCINNYVPGLTTDLAEQYNEYI